MHLEARYEFLDKIGTGSFATVYRARDRELGREVAIKQIHEQYLDDPDQLQRYWQEAQLLASLQHPNIVTMFDIDRDRGWLILELMQTNLADRTGGRPMDLRALRATLVHSLRALKYLHDRGIVHGDVKPGNMMLDLRKRVKLGDFGLARRVSDEEGSLLKGTTKYMAPEAVSEEFGEVGPASDLYSLGFSAYELMCGSNFESLFPGLGAFGRNKQIAWMMWHAAADRRLPEIGRVLQGVPGDLAQVIQKLCEKDGSRRYGSADEALADLNVDVKGPARPVPAEIDEPEEDRTDPNQRRRLLLAGGAFALSLVASLAMLFVPGGGSGETEEPETHVRIVSEVFNESNSLKVEDLDRQFAEELRLGQTPRIYLTNTGKNILLRELRPGDRIRVERTTDEQGNAVKRIEVSRPVSSRGEIRAVDLRQSQVVVAVQEGSTRENLTLRVPQRPEKFLLNENPVRLSELQEGDRVEVAHVRDFGHGGGRVVTRLAARRMRDGVGFIAGVDAEDRRLRVTFGRRDSADSSTLPLAEDCTITLRHGSSGGSSSIGLGAVAEGDRVRLRYDTEIHGIEVTRDAERISGILEEINPDIGRLVVSASNGERIELQLGGDCEVTLGLEPADAADLRNQDQVEVTYDASSSGRPVASTVFATREARFNRWAILIGPDQYDDPSLTPPPSTGRDVAALRDVLLRRYAVPEDRLILLRDEPPAGMRETVSELLSRQVRPQTQVIVYVSGRAYRGDDGRVHLAGTGFDWNRMSETGLALEWLAEQLESCPSRDKLLILDCSHAGRGRDLERQPSTAEMAESLGVPLQSTAVLASCRGEQRGLFRDQKKQGLFAHYLVEGFSGPADRNRDLHMMPAEIFNFLRTRMADVSINGRTQTPVLFLPRR